MRSASRPPEIHRSWKSHGITAARLADDTELQIGATTRVLLTIGDLQPLLAGRASERIARRWFPDYAGEVPARAYPAGWVVASAAG